MLKKLFDFLFGRSQKLDSGISDPTVIANEGEILLPKIHDKMTHGIISKWLVGNGEKVKEGQLIAEIETGKMIIELECFLEGKIEIVAESGEKIPVGDIICKIQ